MPAIKLVRVAHLRKRIIAEGDLLRVWSQLYGVARFCPGCSCHRPVHLQHKQQNFLYAKHALGAAAPWDLNGLFAVLSTDAHQTFARSKLRTPNCAQQQFRHGQGHREAPTNF